MDRLRLKGLGKNILLSLMTFALLFGIAEVSCRLFYDESENYADHIWEIIKEQGFSFKSSFDYTYSDPKTGLIYYSKNGSLYKERYTHFSKKTSTTKKNDTLRVAVLGDSFTNCGGLDSDECEDKIYTTHLEKMLKKAPIENFEHSEVLRFSEGAINTYQEMLILKDAVLDYNPDIIVLQYTDNDDGPVRSELGDNKGLYIYSRTNLLFIGNRIVPTFPFLDEKTNKMILSNSAFARFLSYKMNVLSMRTAVDAELSMDSIREIHSICRERGIRLIIINFPPVSTVGNPHDELMREKISSLSSELDIPYYDLINHVDDFSELESELEKDFPYHYNEKGHRIAAEVLRDAVLEEIAHG